MLYITFKVDALALE